MVGPFTSIHKDHKKAVHTPKHHVLDNKCYRAIKKIAKKKDVTRKNAEANNHQVNAMEPTVKTAKYQIIADLA